jgi:hypothetical protein
MRIRLSCLGGIDHHAAAVVRTLNAVDPLAECYDGGATPDWVDVSVPGDASGVVVDLPAHALVIVRVPAPTVGVGATSGPHGDG